MARSLKSPIDDGMPKIDLGDFIGGLKSDPDPGDLPPNSSPDCENVYAAPGRLLGRLGSIVRNASLPATADGAYYFNDSNGARRLAVFDNGNLYDMTDHSLTLVKAGAYTAGHSVCASVLLRKLYFSDGYTITTSGPNKSGVRYWDPVGAPSDAPLLITSGTASTIETPACKAMTSYTGSLVLVNIKYVDGTTANDAVMWSNVLDPTTIVGTNLFRVAAGQGGELNCIEPMGISAAGVTPAKALFVGKSEKGVYLLQGALSSLSETLINAPVGVLDGASVKFVPGSEGSGVIIFLGTNRQLMWTDGINSDILTRDISKEFAQVISDRLSNSATARFRAVRDWNKFFYILDTGTDAATSTAVQYVYDWQYKYLTRFRGWPTGVWVEAVDASSQPIMYCANTSLNQVNIGLQDDTTPIAKYWKTPWIDAGDPEIWKLWKWLYVAFRTDIGSVTLTATVGQGYGQSGSITLTPSAAAAAASSSDLVWDAGNWDEKNWAAGGSNIQPAYKLGGRIFYTAPDGTTGILGGSDVQIKISDSSVGYFEILKLAVLYLVRGRRRVA
jgi:hypothetical protein